MTREDKLLERITVNPDIFGGKPIIRGMRMAHAGMVLRYLAIKKQPGASANRGASVAPG